MRIDSTDILNKIIEMAIADGVLTPNEQNIIEEICIKYGFDFKTVLKNINKQINELDIDKETELIDYNKRNGDDFEKFIVQKFDKKYFRIKEWAGDKFINGYYAETTKHPDFFIEFQIRKNETTQFSVECKWRQKLLKEGLSFKNNKEQLDRYKFFEEERKIPVFMAIGIGGKGSSPEQLYIVPVKDINNYFIPIGKLIKYKKNIDSNFFFVNKIKQLY